MTTIRDLTTPIGSKRGVANGWMMAEINISSLNTYMGGDLENIVGHIIRH